MLTHDLSTQALQAKLAALHQRVVALERALQQAEQRNQTLETIYQHMPIGLNIWRLEQPDDPRSFRLIAANAGPKDMSAVDFRLDVGRPVVEVFPNIPAELLQLYVDILRSGQPRHIGEILYQDERMGAGFYMVEVIPLPHDCLCFLAENITERKRVEQAREEMIRAQQATLAELSTPLIPLSDQVMVMPLIGSVDSRRAQQVIETLLEGISTSGARVAILDITGVPLVDTQVANALLRAAQAVKLLGAQVVLTGIRPEVAQTLVGLGADLSGIVTRSSLQSGISYAARHG